MMNQSERKVVFYEAKQGKQSILFQNPVKILSHACVGGKKEGEGTDRETSGFDCRRPDVW